MRQMIDLMIRIAEIPNVQFHRSSFANTPVQVLSLDQDTMQQSVPIGILQMQPVLGTLPDRRTPASTY